MNRIFSMMVFTCMLAGLFPCSPTGASAAEISNPDFTLGESIPQGATHDWNLGATGTRGWMHSLSSLATTDARQVLITQVASGSPASGILAVGDVLLGVAGQPFAYDPREELGKAMTNAEASNGKLSLTRWRNGNTTQVIIQLPVLGSYSATAPYNCPKSEEILNEGCAALAARMASPSYSGNAITRSLNALGLLASGVPQYHPLIKKEAEWAANYSTTGFATWYYGYITVFLSEYILATGDTSVLPGLRRIAMEAAYGQSIVGSWGHKFAGPDGRLVGYGMMNSPGAVLTIGLVLARDAGVNEPEVDTAIERSANLLRFYVGKGSVPYGDHNPYMEGHEDNGKCGMAAVLFDQLGEAEGTKFFSQMSTASHGNERDMGHTGNYFNLTWAMPGVARGGPNATGAWMEKFGSWYFDLARKWDWSFPHQGPPQLGNDSYSNWDATGVYLIAYAMPRHAIRLTGSQPFTTPPISPEAAADLIRDGDKSSITEPFSSLGSWSPIVRYRAAKALAAQSNVAIEPVIQLLDDPTIEARLGACEAISRLGSRAQAAVPKLRATLQADDLWLRVKAAEALTAIGTAALVAAPDLLEMVTIGPTAEDPRAMEQRYLVKTLFAGMLKNSLQDVDRQLLLDAVRAGLKNQDGQARGVLAVVYEKLPFADLQPILLPIHRAIIEPAPSGIMFDGTIQTAGLDLFTRNYIDEGIELSANYLRTQKKHGSEGRVAVYLDMLKRYGADAKRAIPLLENAIYYFENQEDDFPLSLSYQKAAECRDAISVISTLETGVALSSVLSEAYETDGYPVLLAGYDGSNAIGSPKQHLAAVGVQLNLSSNVALIGGSFNPGPLQEGASMLWGTSKLTTDADISTENSVFVSDNHGMVLTLTLTNGSPHEITLEKLHWISKRDSGDAPTTVTIAYVSGGLAGSSAAHSLSEVSLQPHDFDLSEILTDNTLAAGESATFTWTTSGSDPSGNDRLRVDNLAFSGSVANGPDGTAPIPNPMTWASLPAAYGYNSIRMTAATALDLNGVEYYFDETSGNPGGTDSGWQDSPSYTDTGLDPETPYTYTVMARDKSVNQNETNPSAAATATTEAKPLTGPVDATTSTVTGSRSAILANGLDSSTVTVTLKDSDGLLIAGEEVSLAGSPAGATISPAGTQTTDLNGQAHFTVSSSTIGVVIFRATSATDGVALSQKFKAQFVHPSTAAAYNVNFLDEGQLNETGLIGVVGEALETWNQGTGYNTGALYNLVDTTGTHVSSISVSGLGNDGRPLVNAGLSVYKGNRNFFDKGKDTTMSITGLTPGTAYNLYIYSLSHLSYGNPTNTERAAGDFVTTNTVTGNGQSQHLDNGTTGTRDDAFSLGGNYVVFESIISDGSGNISILVDAYDGIDGNHTTDDGDCRLQVCALQIRPATGMTVDYTTWSNNHFPAIGLPHEDDDGDGLTNDYEYTFGLDPTNPASINPLRSALDPKTGHFTYSRRTQSLTKMNYKVWYSTDLVDWFEDTAASQSMESETAGIEMIGVDIDPNLLDEPKLFIQVGSTKFSATGP